jgi:disulfide bond formation protein DsbB
MSASRVAMAAGGVSLLLILGALGFQYLADFPPCEMCHWQRWPHIAAAIAGILGGSFLSMRAQKGETAMTLAVLTLVLVAASGAIGAYQAGVEWQFLPGPAACTGPPMLLTGSLTDLNHHVVRCDIAAWRLFGISLAGYNALISFVTVAAGAWLLTRRDAFRNSRTLK